MKNSKLWFKEIMSIKTPNLLHKDLTKVLLLFYIVKNKKFNYCYKISNFNQYVYRFYSDNPEFAKIHPSVVVNSINHYGVKELLPYTIQNLQEWKNDFPNGCLWYDKFNFKVEIEDYTEEVLTFTKNIADMLFSKITNKLFLYNDDLYELESLNNYNLDTINSSRLKNRVFENIQYCSCCDLIDDLYIINIDNNISKITELTNYVPVCKKHYDLYKMGYFKFMENGKISILKQHPDLNLGMRISRKILSVNRKEM